jgi:surface antigen
MRSTIVLLVLAVFLASSACATKSQTGAATGAVGGAVVGGLVGGRGGAVIGGLLGGALGYGIGRHMEKEDQRRMAYAIEQNRRMEWENAQGNHYVVAPTRTYYGSDGRECRNFRMMAEVDGQPDSVNGVACRGSDGGWDIVDTQSATR